MQKFVYVLTDPLGIHARPAGLLVKKAAEYRSKVLVRKDEKTADASKLFSLMSLAAKCGHEIEFIIEGEDEVAAAKALEEFVTFNF